MGTTSLTEQDVQQLENLIFDLDSKDWNKDGTSLKQLCGIPNYYPMALAELRLKVQKSLKICLSFYKTGFISRTSDISVLKKLFAIIKHCYQISNLLSFCDVTNGHPYSLPISKSTIHTHDLQRLCNYISDQINTINMQNIEQEFQNLSITHD